MVGGIEEIQVRQTIFWFVLWFGETFYHYL